MPSGIRLPSLTMILRSEPSGLAENTSPLLALRKNKRLVAAFAVVFLTSNLEDLTAMIFVAPLFIASVLADRLNRKPQFTSIPLDEGAEPGYGFAENQVLYLKGAFVGVERFCIHKKAADVVVCGDAITAQKLARPRDCLAALGRGARFGQ